MSHELSAKLIDTHCHLDFSEFDRDRDTVVRRSLDNGIEYIINIGSSLAGSKRSLELAQEYDCVYASVGIHPHEADSFTPKTQSALSELAVKEKVVAIGEIGLDYFKNYSQAESQRTVFISLIKLAKEKNLPLVIHSRQAQEDTLRILQEHMPLRAVVHCFSGDADFLKACLGLGFFVSFTCNITYKKAQNLRELVKIAPLERLMLETDAPFLAPEGYRGKRNEPMHVKILAEEIARIKEIPLDSVAAQTSHNAELFFGLR